MRRSAGFTLLELLVALAIFALLGAMAFGGLNSVLRSADDTRETSEALGRMQLAFSIMQRDFLQLVDRPVRDAYGTEQPAIAVGEDGETLLRFTRLGQRNPAGLPRSSLQRVRYRLDEGALIREWWSRVDRGDEVPTGRRQILGSVETIELRFLDEKGQWQRQWPPLNQPEKTGLPAALEWRLMTDIGEVRRLFRVR